jgi:hypothetical protein
MRAFDRDRMVLSQIDGHYCADWDELPVSSLTLEYTCCVCYPKTLRGRLCNYVFMLWFNWRERYESR